MTLDEQVQKTAALINARIAEEPAAQGDYFALTPAGREAVRQILGGEPAAAASTPTGLDGRLAGPHAAPTVSRSRRRPR